MTDEFESSTDTPMAMEESEAEAMAGELGPIDSADTSMAGSLPSIHITLEDGEDAVKWGYRKLFGRHEKAPEPGGISIDIEEHEETSMRSSSVAHEDPPPPAPGEHSPDHVTEHRDY